MKHLPQFFAAAGLALAAALFAVPADEARAHSANNHKGVADAAQEGLVSVVLHYIAEHHFDEWNAQYFYGRTPLNLASSHGHLTIALSLIAATVDVNLPDNDNITPLHNAARDGSIPLAEALIAKGASLNVTISEDPGHTPLAWAGANDRTAIFPVLIWAGGYWEDPCADGEIASMAPNTAGRYFWPPDPKCVPGPKGQCTTANWSYTAGQEACVINSYEGANLADSGRSKCRTPATPAGMADASPLCSAAFGAGWDFPTKPTTGDTSPYYVYNCDPDGTRGLIPATVNTIGATECACADADKGVIGGSQVGVSGTTVTVNVGGRCAVCPDDHVILDGACAVDAALAAANAMLRAEIEEDPPDVAAVRRALDGGANPNITTSAGIPVLVAAALGLHAEVISVLITAGADPLVKVAGIHHNTHNPKTLSAFIPGALAERAFRDRGDTAKEFPIGRRWAEAIIHFGDAAGDRFDWEAVDRSGLDRFDRATVTFTAGELVLGFLQMTRALTRDEDKKEPSEEQFSNAIGRYVRDRGESCVDSWYGYESNTVRDRPRFEPLCDDHIVCSASPLGKAYSCSRACDGSPRLARTSETCVSACEENEHAVATSSWPPESRCECEHSDKLDAEGKCLELPAEQDLLDEMRKDSPNIATIRALLSDGASATLTLEDGRPLIFVAVSLRRADIVSVLVTAGARPDVLHNFGEIGFPENFYVPGRIIWGAHAQLARSDGLTRYTRGETATLMIHFAEAVKIAAATSTVSFPWGVPARVEKSFFISSGRVSPLP